MSRVPDALLLQLADAAGLQTAWRDWLGRGRRVEAGTLRSVLEALRLDCASEAQCRESLRMLQDERRPPAETDLLIARSGAPLIVRQAGSLHYRLLLEDGTRVMGTARDVGGGHAAISGIKRPGYHRLEMGRVARVIAVAPRRCPSVAELTGHERAWVLGAQVYSLRRRRGEAPLPDDPARAGIVLPAWETGGDFTGVGRLAGQAAAQGAAGLAISPVHALFTADPARYSPYAPSSRLFLNAMHADPATVFDAGMLRPLLQNGGGPAADLDGCVDRPLVHARRLRCLRRVYEDFSMALPEALVRDFEDFRREGGEALESHARYEALHAHHAATLGAGHGWQDWRAEYRDPGGAFVRRFAEDHGNEIRFHVFLQWLAARGMADAQARARAAGMPVGLIADMAVGTDPRGSHAWSRQAEIMHGVSVGAPPDAFQQQGQNWGLTAFSARALPQRGYGAFIEVLRAVLAHAGGIRVDHALGLARMWLVPEGAGPAEGVYLRYPREALMSLLALEAWRHRALVVGENLGTVPEDFNAALAEHGVLGTSVLWFEQEGGEAPAFRPGNQWPVCAMATVTTHDLPTLRGWWLGRDIQWRERLGELDGEQAAQQRGARAQQRQALWAALRNAGLAPPDAAPPDEVPAEAVLAYVAGTPAALFSIGLEDLLGLEEQPNLPSGPPTAGAGPGHPDWCRALAVAVDELFQAEGVQGLLRVIRQARGDTGATAEGGT
ncbi:4-alpha-glucanotransferase [Alcaligenaceae bacterium]|nr:4-alpha-glucanotransferase [Alcaligenaceae bacterium]